MRRLCTGLLAAALSLGLLAAQPAQAKVYKMAPEERAAALKEKKTKRTKAKKAGTTAPGQGQGGWVEVKPGEKIAKKNKKTKVDEIAQAAEKKGAKGKKPGKAAPEAAEKLDKKAKKKAAVDEIVVEKKGRKVKAEKKSDKKRKSSTQGDRLVGSNYSGEKKVSGSNAEVRRPGAGPSDDLNSYSVSRPGQDKASAAPVVPEVRQEVQPGPVDASKPVGTEQKAGEGRF